MLLLTAKERGTHHWLEECPLVMDGKAEMDYQVLDLKKKKKL